jgi:UDP-glucuronate 4-epimerase
MNFLVTGGAGFIGSHVCERLLKEGHGVWALDDLNDFYDPAIKQKHLREIESLGGNFHFVHGDIVDADAVKKTMGMADFDQVIHLAARGGVRPSLQQPALYQRVNVEGTVNVLEGARQRGIDKVILASSSSVYGAQTKTPFSETDPIQAPISPYASSKISCEGLGHVYHHLYGMSVIVLRFFTVYGERQRPDLAIHKFSRMITYEKPVTIYGDGESARDYTYISDIVDGMIGAVGCQAGFDIFNLGHSKAVTLNRLIRLLEQTLDKKARCHHLPLQPGDVPRTWADVSKAKALLGYSPQVTLEEGIKRFVDWTRQSSSG